MELARIELEGLNKLRDQRKAELVALEAKRPVTAEIIANKVRLKAEITTLEGETGNGGEIAKAEARIRDAEEAEVKAAEREEDHRRGLQLRADWSALSDDFAAADQGIRLAIEAWARIEKRADALKLEVVPSRPANCVRRSLRLDLETLVLGPGISTVTRLTASAMGTGPARTGATSMPPPPVSIIIVIGTNAGPFAHSRRGHRSVGGVVPSSGRGLSGVGSRRLGAVSNGGPLYCPFLARGNCRYRPICIKPRVDNCR